MGFQPSDDSPNRLDYARRVAGALAYIAAHQGDAVGLYCAGKEFKKEITPKRGAAHMGVILDAIAEMEPSEKRVYQKYSTKQRKKFLSARYLLLSLIYLWSLLCFKTVSNTYAFVIMTWRYFTY